MCKKQVYVLMRSMINYNESEAENEKFITYIT